MFEIHSKNSKTLSFSTPDHPPLMLTQDCSRREVDQSWPLFPGPFLLHIWENMI